MNIVPMHMPGHKRNVKMLGNKLPYEIDITEIDGFDDFHHAEGVIKQIEDKAKKIKEKFQKNIFGFIHQEFP